MPVTPGYLGEDQDAERLQTEADAIGYPVLIKAVAGGGGKGMRRVDAARRLRRRRWQLQARGARRPSATTAVLIEKYITAPRHIEVQVFGDSHGNVVHLFERDCSLQRRHQKVIEEAPAPGMDEATREAVCAAAVRGGQGGRLCRRGDDRVHRRRRRGRCSADRIWFMEMNTRLQVEHPVTEEITGAGPGRMAAARGGGEPLPLTQDELAINGWAIEARLYAEDPAKGFLPATGPLTHFALPGRACASRPGSRRATRSRPSTTR